MDKTLIIELEQFARRQVAGGFADPDQIVESTVEAHPDQADEEQLQPVVEGLVGADVARHLAEQQAWPEVTDCDRLDAALDELTAAGIVCRQDFTCCSNCGESEIGGEMADARDAGLEVRGYAFYHQQDTDRGVEGGGVYLKYGAVTEGDAALLAVGHEIADCVRRHGLAVEWGGSAADAILVRLDWKRRREPNGDAIVPESW